MTFWIIAAIMTVGAVAMLAIPLLRRPSGQNNSAAYDLEVYRDQLAELERDNARGMISDDEMEAARTEIARRMLAADARLQKQAKRKSSGGLVVKVLAGLLAVAIAGGAVLAYLQIGSPGAPDMPLASRTDLPAPGEDGRQHRQLIAQLRQEVEENPAEAEAWLRLGAAYKAAQMWEEAADALRRAIGLAPPTPELNSEYGEALVMAAEGAVTPEAKAAFDAVLAENPGDARAHYYLALGDYQAGRTQEALDRWAELVAVSPADAPWLPLVRQQVARAAEELGLDVAEVTPEPLPPRTTPGTGGAPALTPEQRAELESMSPEERETMIRGMVDGLDARLREDPTDLQGWERLIRARIVLGERDAAQNALNRAVEAFAGAPVPTGRLIDLARELDLETPESAAQAPNVEEMVEGLAARLEKDPDDLEGWMMLARSYLVLGNSEKAREAIANAARLAPDDPRVLTLQARAIRDANGGVETEETTALMRRVLELDPENIEALWFVGNAEAEAGNNEKARELLERLLTQIPPDSPDREFVEQRLQEIPEN